MASSSSDATIPFIFPNLNHLISVKLDGSNYLSWVSQFLPVLRSNDLLSIVDGSETCPSKFLVDSNGKPTLELDPKFTLWTKKDQYLLSWLNATLSETILPTVFGLNTSKEVWDLLSNRFAAQNRSRITHLKRQLQNLQQGNKSCTEYIQAAKGWANQLAAVGKSIDDDDLISYIISGLNTAYTPFITSFSFATRHTSLSFNEFQSELISYETLLETQIKSVPPEAGQFALFNQYRNSPGFNKKQRYGQPRHSPRMTNSSYSARPQYSSQTRIHTCVMPEKIPRNEEQPQNTIFNKNRTICQICNKPDHQALDCYHRIDFSYQGHHPPSRLAAMAAHTHNFHDSEPWFADSGANSHITSALDNLALQQPYQGDIYSATPSQQVPPSSVSHTELTSKFFSTPLYPTVTASTSIQSISSPPASDASSMHSTPAYASLSHDQPQLPLSPEEPLSQQLVPTAIAPSTSSQVIPSAPQLPRMLTRSLTGSLKLKQMSDFHLYYSTRHPLKALHTRSRRIISIDQNGWHGFIGEESDANIFDDINEAGMMSDMKFSVEFGYVTGYRKLSMDSTTQLYQRHGRIDHRESTGDSLEVVLPISDFPRGVDA
ncbi:hypothetical protein SADUNF_Sadunf15G0007400 [Salix dunnii]|uniref:Retrotransposon Copia-like N-terminal domain-containing protein n=1 Tax=Salix dunnii TaxID=1413687 RepID=A0A835J9V9_9ROSI|nr:hypothetical protein SADUNF_Sadunf15G0007400 [Salix dunnii]